MTKVDDDMKPWTPPPEAPDAETNVGRWALDHSSDSATKMASLYLAMSWCIRAAIPFSQLTGGLDAVRSRWLLAALADKVNDKWLGTYADEIAQAYPELAEAARAASTTYNEVRRR